MDVEMNPKARRPASREVAAPHSPPLCHAHRRTHRRPAAAGFHAHCQCRRRIAGIGRSRDADPPARQPGDDLHLPYWAEVWESAGHGLLLRAAVVADVAGRWRRHHRPLRRAVHARVAAGAGAGPGLRHGAGRGGRGPAGRHVTFADLEPPALPLRGSTASPTQRAATTAGSTGAPIVWPAAST